MTRKKRSIRDKLNRRQASAFAGRHREIALFREQVKQSEETRDFILFSVFGQGGVGKSTLLNRWREVARDEANALTALTDESEHDLLAVMTRLAQQFAAQNRPLAQFDAHYSRYRQHKATLDQADDAPTGIYGYAAGTLTRTAFHALRMADAGGLTGGMGTAATMLLDEAQMVERVSQWADYVRRKLGSQDAPLVLAPVETLTPLFLDDLYELSEPRPVVLCFDTYERTHSFLDDWLRQIFDERYGVVSSNILWLIAGRDGLDKQVWHSYEPLISHISLAPFTEAEATLYLNEQGVTDPAVVTLILNLSGGLPLLVSTLAQDAPRQVSESSTTAVDRFLKWIDEPRQRQIALHAALPRRLNRDVLAALTDDPDQADPLFTWLTARPFVLERQNGWQYHDVAREQFTRYLHRRSPNEWRELHQTLADYHDQQRHALGLTDLARQVEHADWLHHTAEWMYHRLAGAGEAASAEVLNVWLLVFHERRKVAQMLAEGLPVWGEQLGLFSHPRSEHQTRLGIWQNIIQTQSLSDMSRVRLYQERGYMYHLKEQYDEAFADYSKAIELDPTYQGALGNRGSIYRLQGEYALALADLNKAIRHIIGH